MTVGRRRDRPPWERGMDDISGDHSSRGRGEGRIGGEAAGDRAAGIPGEEHERIREALGAYAADGCDGDELRAVEAHLAGCRPCAEEAGRLRRAAGWLAADQLTPPPARLRESVLAAAFARRRPAAPAASASKDSASDDSASAAPARPPTAAEVYATQVRELDALLAELSAEEWQARVVDGWTVEDLMAHLTASDRALAIELGLRGTAGAVGDLPPASARTAWREQAQAVLEHVTGRGPDALDRPVHVADPRHPRQPVRVALAQRAFEAWIHTADIRSALGRPAQPPPAGMVRGIVDLGVRLLPSALHLAGAEHPGRTAQLVLDGDEGGRWTVPLGPGTAPAAPAVTVAADAVEFCFLMGNRRPAAVARTVGGDPALADDLLRVTATLGCD
ncbi:MAG TPA: maleylpyruvate isomerase family mycothiol-dependent enzyme [Actinomycetes bacterium]|nr:maleylpyruvate isomerase family mycothiol-dependent enzyme [Actinomycetes bacterium]